MKQASITFFTCLLISTLSAQISWQDMLVKEQHTRDEIKDQFEVQTFGKSYKKGSGQKQFQRWNNFWEHRLLPDGSFPDVRSWYKNNWSNLNGKSNTNGNWISLGPSNHLTTSSWSSGTGRVNVVVEDPNNPSILYVGTPAGGIWKSIDDGNSWDPLSDQLASIGVSDIAINPDDSDVIYLGTGDRDGGNTYSIGVVKSTDGGQSWQMIGPDMGTINRLIIDPGNSEEIWAAAKNGLYHSIDEGNTWEIVSSINAKDMSFKPFDANTFYVISGNNLLRTSDHGFNFELAVGLPENSGRMLMAVTEADPDRVYVLSADEDYSFQGVFLSVNSGVSFIPKNSTDNIFDNSEQAWYDMAITVSNVNPNVVFTGVINIWASTNGGNSFTRMNSWSAPSSPSYTHADIHYLKYYGNKLYCGSDGGVYRSYDNANSFEDLSAGLEIGQFYSIANTIEDNTIAGGLQDNGSYVQKEGQWKNYVGADGMESGIDPDNSDRIFGMVQYGGLYVSEDGGNTITSLGMPSENGKWVTPMAMDPLGGRLLAGYDQLYEYDFENGWNQISTFDFPEKLSEIEISESNPNMIVVSCGNAIFKTIDGGQSWTNINGTLDFHVTSIEIHPTLSNVIWLSIGDRLNGEKVYRTDDGGQSWNNISGNLPNLPTNVIAYDVNTDGLYVGNDIGVYYSANENISWVDFDNNLPNVIVTDIEINSGISAVQIGTFGRGVWQSEIYGADLFENDIAINEIISPDISVCGLTTDLEFVVKNVGTNEVSGMTINYTFGQELHSQQWDGLIEVGEERHVLLEDVSLSLGQSQVNIEILSSNETTDGNLHNNSLSKNFEIHPNGIFLSFSLFTDCYASETSWEIINTDGEIVQHGLAGELENLSTYVYDMCLPVGCYSLKIADTYGDGLAGSEANCEVNGDYFIQSGDEEIVSMSIANFENEVIHEFCIGEEVELIWTQTPSNTTISCDEANEPDVLGWATALSSCMFESETIQYNDVHASNTIIRTWSASDSCGNEISYDQIIELSDFESPVLVCSEDIILPTLNGQEFVEVTLPTVTDNCSVSAIVNSYNGSEDASDSYFSGTTMLTWIAMDSFGNQGTCSQSITINDSIISGIENQGIEDGIGMVIYPNPNFGKNLNIHFSKPLDDPAEISIMDPTGRIILNKSIGVSASSMLNLSLPDHLASGVYFVQLSSENHITTEKLILERK